MEKLKPCPFCGGEVSIALTGNTTVNWFFIKGGHSKDKQNCNCRVFMESERYFLGCMDFKEARERAYKDLINAWNTRKDECAYIHIDPLQIRLTDEQMEEVMKSLNKEMLLYRGAL